MSPPASARTSRRMSSTRWRMSPHRSASGPGRQIGRPCAGKTGTSEERKSVWWAGYVPQLSVAVAIYKETDGVKQPLRNIPGYGNLVGAGIPLSVWIDLMKPTLDGVPVVDFPARVGVGDNKVPTPPRPRRRPPRRPPRRRPSRPRRPQPGRRPRARRRGPTTTTPRRRRRPNRTAQAHDAGSDAMTGARWPR